MTTVAEIIRQVRRNISDMDKVGYDDEELLQWVNEGNGYIRKLVDQYKPNLLYRRETGEGKTIDLADVPMKIHRITVENRDLQYLSLIHI